ncbi:hypothetical protein [Streptomyces sp. GC420]|uniref:hypothetical protein n=1 Tax=Streptomyces sp. GC420 TaxID=2697568 RepID=UPI001414EA7E|nr:hypothetical protein [Streptomyces sp. GC420]NBM17337.1 hypothetical protein [Streptomyces sp. GC420]
MSPADDGYSEYGEYGDPSGAGGSGQTRTRMPESRADALTGSRRPARSTRGLVTVVGVVVLLIAAIAFANRGGSGGSEGSGTEGDGAKGRPTAPTGERPVDSKSGGIPSGFAQTEQGAQSAAANYAVVLGSDGMFNGGRRHGIVQTVAHPDSVDRLQDEFDAAYSTEFLEQVGLDEDGAAPVDSTFVSRTLPAGTKIKAYGDGAAEVAVWCNSLFGLTGEDSTKPVTSSWFTLTVKLKWNGSDWKVLETGQQTGPTPVTGDNPVSGSDEIADAVNEFGGFTYAR